MLTKGKFLVSFEVPGHTKEYTEGFTEELIITYRTEELRPYLIFPRVKLNPNHLHVYHTKRIISELIGMPYSSIKIVDLKKLQDYQDNFDEEEHDEIIDYYINFLEKPETLYTFTEKIISLLKSFIK